MVYRNKKQQETINAGRLGAGFISMCLETRWLGHFGGFYVLEPYCTSTHHVCEYVGVWTSNDYVCEYVGVYTSRMYVSMYVCVQVLTNVHHE